MFKNIDIHDIVDIAKKAGKKIIEIYDADDCSIEIKGDNSPLTKADTLANEIIVSKLKKYFPQIPILSEEGKEIPYSTRKKWEYFWCVDPLDGTKEFIKRNGEFTVNISLIHKNKAVLGVIYAPVLEEVFYAKKGNGAFKENKYKEIIQLEKKQTTSHNSLRVVASRSHAGEILEEYIDHIRQKKLGMDIDYVSMGSSLKFCLIAEGKADIYPRFVPTMEWDTAAAHAILDELGYQILVYPEGNALSYNKEILRNPYFIAS